MSATIPVEGSTVIIDKYVEIAEGDPSTLDNPTQLLDFDRNSKIPSPSPSSTSPSSTDNKSSDKPPERVLFPNSKHSPDPASTPPGNKRAPDPYSTPAQEQQPPQEPARARCHQFSASIHDVHTVNVFAGSRIP